MFREKLNHAPATHAALIGFHVVVAACFRGLNLGKPEEVRPSLRERFVGGLVDSFGCVVDLLGSVLKKMEKLGST